MFDLIDGIPVHPLVVHAVVVLLPLAILGTIGIAVRADWRTRYGHLVLAASAVATALIPVATSSGEALEKHVGDPGKHAQLGDQLIWFAVPLLLLDVALVYLAHRRPTQGTTLKVIAALSMVAAVAAGVQVYRVGESGARAAWGDKVASSQSR